MDENKHEEIICKNLIYMQTIANSNCKEFLKKDTLHRVNKYLQTFMEINDL